MPEIKCAICGEVMPDGICGYWAVGEKGINAHIGCAETGIEVYRIEAVGLGTYYYEKDLPPLADLMDGAGIGDGYQITKEEMQHGAYLTLPEFTGF